MPRIVVVGGSAGALKALKAILPALPPDFPAAILIVTHIGAHKSVVPDILARCSAMPVRHASDGEAILPGQVLVAPPDQHLTVVASEGGAHVRLLRGPRENHCRPAIDPLFRSAASAFRDDAIGVLLSGYLDDGTVGLQAIKACGGLAIVQDPLEAEALDMPASALEHVDVDRVLRAAEIGAVLVELTGTGPPPGGPGRRDAADAAPDWVRTENRMCSRESDMADLDRLGQPASLTCPACAGALWEMTGSGPLRYRCHTGHAFTAQVLRTLQRDAVEEAVWGAIRALHEQERLFGKLAGRESGYGQAERAADYLAKSAQAKLHAQTLREMIAARALLAGDDPAQAGARKAARMANTKN